MKKLRKIMFSVMITFMFIQFFSNHLNSQHPNGYVFTYDDSGNRLTRSYVEVSLKSADSSMTEATIGNFNIKIYPNPTKGQLTLNIANLGKDDKAQMFLYNFSGNEIGKLDFSKVENTIDMSRQLNGTYYLRVIIGEQTETFKIIKMD